MKKPDRTLKENPDRINPDADLYYGSGLRAGSKSEAGSGSLLKYRDSQPYRYTPAFKWILYELCMDLEILGISRKFGLSIIRYPTRYQILFFVLLFFSFLILNWIFYRLPPNTMCGRNLDYFLPMLIM